MGFTGFVPTFIFSPLILPFVTATRSEAVLQASAVPFVTSQSF